MNKLYPFSLSLAFIVLYCILGAIFYANRIHIESWDWLYLAIPGALCPLTASIICEYDVWKRSERYKKRI